MTANTKTLIIVFIVLLVSILSLDLFPADALAAVGSSRWEPLKSDGGVHLFVRNVGGQTNREFKAVTEVKVPVKVILRLLKDIPAYPRWFGDCKAAGIIESYSEEHLLIYYAVQTPLFFADRDLVATITHLASSDGDHTVVIRATRNGNVPEKKDHIRVVDLVGRFVLTRTNQSTTRVSYSVRVSMGENFPQLLSDEFIKDQLMKVALGMKQIR